jgi:selenocysteine lyase/cysteine desulfurase
MLTSWLLDRLGALRHSNGAPMVRVYGPTSVVSRGGTIAFNFLDPDGHLVDERAVGRDASAGRISLRTGCSPTWKRSLTSPRAPTATASPT